MKKISQYFKIEQIKYIYRNIGRKKKQTFFTILCIAISSFIILGNIALNNGIQSKLRISINEAISGQLTIYSTDDANINILESQLKEQKSFEWNEHDEKQFGQLIPDILIFKRIRFGSLISYGERTSYNFVHALENLHLERITNLISLKHGAIPNKSNEILISESLARDLICNIGDTVLLMAENTNNYMSDEISIVSGIFQEKGLAVFFNYTSFMPYDLGKEIVQLENGMCLELVVNSSNNEELSPYLIRELEDYLTNKYHGKLKVAHWNKTVPLLFTIVNIWKRTGTFMQIIFIAFSLIILVNLISLIVYSRKKEFGTLLAMGFSWENIQVMICLEYFFLTFFSVLLGYLIVSLFILLIPKTGINISSKDMQSALMSDSIVLFLYPRNICYVFSLFSLTILLSVWISIMRIKRNDLVTLIKNK